MGAGRPACRPAPGASCCVGCGAMSSIAILSGATERRWGTRSGSTVAPSSTTSTTTSRAVVGPLGLTIHKVLGRFSESPALTNPEGEHPPGLDPTTGLTMDLDPNVEAYLPVVEWDEVFWVSPAFVFGRDVVGAEAVPLSTVWVVDPQFSAEGDEKFRVATAELTEFSPWDDRRSIAAVVDGRLQSAPYLSEFLDRGDSLDPDIYYIVVHVGDEDAAEAVAAAIRRAASEL